MKICWINYKRYTFNPEDDWGDYDNGVYRKGVFDKRGYCYHHYRSYDGKRITTSEHRAKWIYFNGEIPDGYEVDHIIPISEGGTNKLSNLRICTHPDNMLNSKTRVKLSNAKKGNQWNKGVKHSEERVKKRANKIRGCKHSVESIIRSANGHKKAVVQYSKEGVFIKEWDSATDASKELGISKNGISRVCKNKLKTSGGYIWKWKK